MTWDEFIAECIPSPDTITVRLYTGSGAYGDLFGDPIQVEPCVVDETRRMVTVQTVDAQGEQVLSSSTVFAPLAEEIQPGSLVTLPGRTRAARVLAVARLTAHGLDLPQHQELSLE